MPLHLLLGFRTSFTPSVALHRRRTSPGMSLKYRHCSFAFQMGPSVNQKPVQSFSTVASLSTSFSSSGDLTSTVIVDSVIAFSRLPIIQAQPENGRAWRFPYQFPILTFSFRETICCVIRRVKFEQHADGLIFWKRMERDETEEPMNFTVNQGEPE